jgi:hypothetical protein
MVALKIYDFLGKADADNLAAAKAMLKGLKTRYEKTGVALTYIHTVHVNLRRPLPPLLTRRSLLSSLALVSQASTFWPGAMHSRQLDSNNVAVLFDDAAGNRGTDTIYDDANPGQIETLPDTQIHRNVELELIKADQEGALEKPYVPRDKYPCLPIMMEWHGAQDTSRPTLYHLR